MKVARKLDNPSPVYEGEILETFVREYLFHTTRGGKDT